MAFLKIRVCHSKNCGILHGAEGLKILKVIASLAPSDGGPFKTCPELAETLTCLGHTVDIYTTNHKQTIPVPLEVPVETHGVRTTYFPIGLARSWRFSYPLARALSHDIPNYDIVHIYSFYLFHGFITGYYCRKYDVPYIVQPHGVLDPYLRKRHRFRKWLANYFYESKNLRGAKAILFNTEEEQRLALPVIGKTKSVIVPLGLHLEDYQNLPKRGRFRSKYPQIEDKQMLLYLSRINFKKGLDVLVGAFARLTQTRKDVHLVIAGPDSDGLLARVRRWCHDAGISEFVTFVGMLSEEDKRAALVDADLFTLTSYAENFGVTILEALACGTPVLISDKVNIWREVVKGEAGCITRCDAVEASAVMDSMLAHPEQLRRMGENGKRLVLERFDWTAVARQQEVVYAEALARC